MKKNKIIHLLFLVLCIQLLVFVYLYNGARANEENHKKKSDYLNVENNSKTSQNDVVMGR